LTIDSWFDPQVEFLEVAVEVNGQRTWKVYGPDISGAYGGMQGAGGLEATVRESDGVTTGLLNDYYGNSLATISGGAVSWKPTRVNGYGPLFGFEAPTLSLSVPVAEATVWRGQRIDPTGFYNLGARHYDPTAGRFLSVDPLGHAASMDLYSAFNGDGVNYFDADGRFGKGLFQGRVSGDMSSASSGAYDTGYWVGENAATVGQGISIAIDTAVNLIGGSFISNVDGDENSRRALAQSFVDSPFGSPMRNLFGAYEDSHNNRAFAEQLPVDLAPAAQDLAMAYAARPGVGSMPTVPEPNYSAPSTGFYVTPDGVAVPSTGYRAIGGPNVAEAQNGVIEPRDYPGTYVTFNNLLSLNQQQVMSGNQSPPARRPTHIAVFDTLQTIPSLNIPRGLHGEGLFPEPITSWYPGWGQGGFSQATTFEPIQGAAVVPIMSGSTVNRAPSLNLSTTVQRAR
jgi:RHS repeat-associated protein